MAFVVGQRLLLESCKVDVLVAVERIWPACRDVRGSTNKKQEKLSGGTVVLYVMNRMRRTWH